MNAEQKAYEESIRANERGKFQKQIDKAAELIDKGISILGAMFAVSAESRSPNGHAPTPKGKRKPTTVSDTDRATVLEHLLAESQGHTDEAFSPKEIARLTDLGAKTVGAALRQLTEVGEAVEKPRGKWRAVLVPAEKSKEGNGASA